VIEHGTVRTGGGDLPLRLRSVHEAVARLIGRHSPGVVALERAFFGRNAASALRIGEARGAVMVASALAGVPVREFAPARVKRAITGSGRASKSQVAGMVVRLLSLRARPAEDAADALAIALCHLHHVGRILARAPVPL
ncbi:MAG: crossover junction endodeoxyribonuclease RuvC, partial [Lentisphaerae bacterium]|nr:crossover junction endodeoxyribonuclease RuvC [Lentisphaerota bacterium]